jgi:hypothetical protein
MTIVASTTIHPNPGVNWKNVEKRRMFAAREQAGPECQTGFHLAAVRRTVPTRDRKATWCPAPRWTSPTGRFR